MQILKTWRLAIVVGIVCLFCMISSARLRTYSQSFVTGAEKLALQQETIHNLYYISDQLDNVTTLYLSGSITQETYEKHIGVLQKQYTVAKKKHDQMDKDYRVDAAELTYVESQGIKSTDESLRLMGVLLDSCEKHADNKDELSYYYLAAGESLSNAVAGYMAAVEIEDGNTEKSTQTQ